MSKQVLVEALKAYKEKGIQDKVLGRIPEEGEQWYIPSERLNTLLGDNEYHLAFVKVVESDPTEEQDDSVESTEELDLTEEQNTSSESTEESKTTGEEKVNDEPIIIENESLTTKTQKKYSKSK